MKYASKVLIAMSVVSMMDRKICAYQVHVPGMKERSNVVKAHRILTAGCMTMTERHVVPKDIYFRLLKLSP